MGNVQATRFLARHPDSLYRSPKSSRTGSENGAGASSGLHDAPEEPRPVTPGLLDSGELDDVIELTVRNKIANELKHDPSRACDFLRNVTDPFTVSAEALQDKAWQAFFKDKSQEFKAGAFTEFVWRETFALCFNLPDILQPEQPSRSYKMPRDYFGSWNIELDPTSLEWIRGHDLSRIPPTWRDAFVSACEMIVWWTSNAESYDNPEEFTWATNRDWDREKLDWALWYVSQIGNWEIPILEHILQELLPALYPEL